MTAPAEGAQAPAGEPPGSYKLVSATFRGKAYPDGHLLLDEAGRVIELRQTVGRKKKEQATVARFRLEPNAEVLVDGPNLRVSELSVTLDSPAAAKEVAEILGHPAREREAVGQLAEAESAVTKFLEKREDAVTFLNRITVNPREALFSAESMWVDETKEPLDSVCAGYSAGLAEPLQTMMSSLAAAERKLGPRVTDALYALAYTIGSVQNALLGVDPDLTQELSALQQLGISTTAQDLQADGFTERLMTRAHPFLVEAASSPAQPN